MRADEYILTSLEGGGQLKRDTVFMASFFRELGWGDVASYIGRKVNVRHTI